MKPRILLVDDEVDYTHLLKMNLELLGRYEIMEENCASHAVSTAKGFKPDLILLDVMMPEMDGPAVAEELQADESLRRTPMAFVTALVSRDGANSFSDGDEQTFLPKGDLLRLLAFIEQTTARRERETICMN